MSEILKDGEFCPECGCVVIAYGDTVDGIFYRCYGCLKCDWEGKESEIKIDSEGSGDADF